MTPFARLGLLAGGVAYAVALLLVNEFLGFPAAVFAGVLAPIVAAVSTLEISSGSSASSEVEKQEALPNGRAAHASEDFTIRARERRDIEETARTAREE